MLAAKDPGAIARREKKKARVGERARELAANKQARTSTASPAKEDCHPSATASEEARRERSGDIRSFFVTARQPNGPGRMPHNLSSSKQDDSGFNEGEASPEEPDEHPRSDTPTVHKSRVVRLSILLRDNGEVGESGMRLAEASIHERKESVVKQRAAFANHDIGTGDAKAVVVDDGSAVPTATATPAHFRLSDGTHVGRESAEMELKRLQSLWEKADNEERLTKARSSWVDH